MEVAQIINPLKSMIYGMSGIMREPVEHNGKVRNVYHFVLTCRLPIGLTFERKKTNTDLEALRGEHRCYLSHMTYNALKLTENER